uniref:SEC7 domain-containing protein n=1 Tax=Physcomitrium patens TaxID=3218 RepID=A0A2K1J0D6_PHYPA|nr:hypothetical protein PHYPA_022896 [Physcomitrium patens]
MAEAGGAFVTRAFESMLKDSAGRKYGSLQIALKAYLDRKPVSPSPAPQEEPEPIFRDEISVVQGNVSEGDASSPEEGDEKVVQTSPVVSPAKPSTGQSAAAALSEAGHMLDGSEADLVILPLRLAFETKQSKLMEPALDCLHKLISYGHLVGEAGVEGGRNAQLGTEIVNMVCASADTTAPDSLVLQVIKVLLTALASPTFQVRGECLLTAVRTCYNIVLSSKNPVNQATAKATLTQMINIVLRRMESDIEAGKNVQSPSAQASDDAYANTSNDEGPVASLSGNLPHEDDGQNTAEPGLVYSRTTTIHIDPESGEARNASTGKSMEMSLQSLPTVPSTPPPVSIAEFQHLATKSDFKGIEAALEQAVTPEGAIKNHDEKDLDLLTLGQKDALLVLRTICKTMIGDYLGQHDEFPLAVMHAYVDALNFSGMKFDKAIRMFLNEFRLPGEAQKIDPIMEKFAERYCRDNPNLFKNADTAYTLAYAVILLNTDAHNPMVTKKITKSDFVRMNSSSDVDEHAAPELLEEIYESIVGEEIKLKDENSKRERSEERRSLVSTLNLGGFGGRDATDIKKETDEIIVVTQSIFKKAGFKRGVFHKAEHEDLARPMLEAVGWPLLAAFSVTMEDSDNKSRVLLCMEGVRLGIHLTKALGMETMRYAFLTSLVRFTFLHTPREMRSKNVEALKTLLSMCQNEPEALQDTWNAVLECVSRLQFIITTPGMTSTLMQGSNQISRDSLLLSLTELTGKATEQVFVNSVRLPSDVIVEFFAALCGVSAEELRQSPPRVFSLTKLVEISSYNMTRIRMVWARIWSVLSVHFVAAGSHSEEKIAMYSIDSLRQLAMFKSKVGSIKSGWRSVFMILSTAAYDDVVSISDTAFENVEQVVLEHFDQVLGDCFMDCVNCLIAFANNKISPQTSLKAIALLRICEDRLADGQIGGDVWKVGGSGDQPDLEVAEYYWFPMLAGLSDLTSDPRIEVRNCALEVLFDLLKERGKNFSGAFWEMVFHRVLFPIFDHVRHAGKDGEKPASADQWLRETCIHSLQLLCDLFSSFYKEVSFLLPALLGLLLDCGTRPDQTLAAISMGALVRLTEVGGHQFNDKDWTTLLDSIRDACYTTQPVELLNPESMLTFGSDYVSGHRALSIAAPPSSMRGGHCSRGQSERDGGHFDTHDNGSVEGTPKSMSNGDTSKTNRGMSNDAMADDRLERLSNADSEGSDAGASVASPRDGKASGRSFMSNVMDTLLLKNTTFRSVRSKPADHVHNSLQDVDEGDQGPDDSEVEGLLLQDVRTKCVIQLLLLGALDSLQRNHWQRLQPSHKRLVMDTLLSMVDFAASYNSDSNLRSRMQHLSGDRPPPNLLRQETEGTKIYLAVLNKTTAESVDEVRGHESMEQGGEDPESGEISWKGGEQKLREEGERQLVSFCGHVLKEVAALQPGLSEAVLSDFHRALDLRSAVTAEVLKAMRDMDTLLFKKHLPEFYPYFTKLICSDQMDVRKALGKLFRVQLVALLP